MEENKNEIMDVEVETHEETTGHGVIGKLAIGAIVGVGAGLGAWLYRRRRQKKVDEYLAQFMEEEDNDDYNDKLVVDVEDDNGRQK